MDITLAEALIIRSDLQKSIDQLNNRLMDNIQVQEGDEPSLSPEDLKRKIFNNLNDLTILIGQINHTNNMTKFNEEMTLMEALAERDNLSRKRTLLSSMINRASISDNRYSMSEIKFVNVIDVEKTQKELDDISKEWRQLDTRIQQLNWTTNLIK